ncbi:MAG: rhomboid family intramembrane serine protease [Methyloceanibacter sp.]|uniref:rhomboid family intramembrane serine protease n=1 Tax=Methyloceanibacter sp. TaxID=1965321 RepID=UPI003D6CBDE0
MAEHQPILNVPRAVVVASALIVGVQAVRGFLPDEIDVTVLLALAFIPARYSGAALDLPGGYVTAVTSFVTYMIVHGGWLHVVVNVLWMLAFGSAVARRIGTRGFFEFSILCGIAGALTHLAFHWGGVAPVVGASAAISGQMAGALRFIFFAGRGPGERAPDFVNAPLASLGTTLKDRRIVAFLVFWVVLNAYFGLSAVSLGGTEGGIAWEAHIGGFLTGLLTFGYFDRRSRPGEAERNPGLMG